MPSANPYCSAPPHSDGSTEAKAPKLSRVLEGKPSAADPARAAGMKRTATQALKRQRSEQPPKPPARPPLLTKAPSSQPSFRTERPASLPERQPDTPVEILWSSLSKPQPVSSKIMASSCASYSELWTAVSRVCGDKVNRATARLVYQDKDDGDWLMLMPDGPSLSLFAKTVKKVLVVVNESVNDK